MVATELNSQLAVLRRNSFRSYDVICIFCKLMKGKRTSLNCVATLPVNAAGNVKTVGDVVSFPFNAVEVLLAFFQAFAEAGVIFNLTPILWSMPVLDPDGEKCCRTWAQSQLSQTPKLSEQLLRPHIILCFGGDAWLELIDCLKAFGSGMMYTCYYMHPQFMERLSKVELPSCCLQVWIRFSKLFLDCQVEYFEPFSILAQHLITKPQWILAMDGMMRVCVRNTFISFDEGRVEEDLQSNLPVCCKTLLCFRIFRPF